MKTKLISVRYAFGDEVYLKHDPSQLKRMVCAYMVDNTGVLYKLICGVETSYHYEYEISKTRELINV